MTCYELPIGAFTAVFLQRDMHCMQQELLALLEGVESIAKLYPQQYVRYGA
jgi:hypothetical protein